MINAKSIEAVDKAHWRPGFIRPLYSSYCFSRIPHTLMRLFGIPMDRTLPGDCLPNLSEPYHQVCVVLIDAFGWKFFEKYADRYPFLKRFLDHGICSKITSQFPSTTANHITCINTGLSVGESGVYEWYMYEPKADAIITPLLFTFAGDKQTDGLKKAGLKPSAIFPTDTIYRTLEEQGINSYVIQSEDIVFSSYSECMFGHAKRIGFEHFQDGLTQLEKLIAMPERFYAYLYFGAVDSAGHKYGEDSPQFEESVHETFTLLENSFQNFAQKGFRKRALVLIADHGMIRVSPKDTLYLNQKIPDIKEWMALAKSGKPLVPAGSCRDFFLHVKPEYFDKALTTIQECVGERGIVVPVSELIEEGLFGEKAVSQAFLNRVGNMVVLPYAGEGVWWLEKGRFEQHFYGAHGGLTRGEMETIFLIQDF